MLSCCNQDFAPTYSFYTDDEAYLVKRVEFGYCPHCKKAVYRETRIDFRDTLTQRDKKSYEAERAFSKAMFNRLVFVSKLEQGSKANQNWCYGDFKKLPQRDEKGRYIQVQTKRNMNGVEVEELGIARVSYR